MLISLLESKIVLFEMIACDCSRVKSLNWRPDWISSVKQIHCLPLGSSLKSCLLIGRLIEILGPCWRFNRIYNLFQKVLKDYWLHICHHGLSRSLFLRLGVYLGSPSMLKCLLPRVILKYQSVLTYLAIFLIVRCIIGMLGYA